MIIRKRSQFPKCIRHFKEVKGICIGKCIDPTWKINSRHIAHAHIQSNDDYKGWICLRLKSQLKERFTMLHEAAHILAGEDVPHHGKKWREIVEAIGGTYKPYRSHCKRFIYKDFSPKKKK